ncbi:hypothetical protein N7468_010451 [Penicillium chermesinum]|uniref:ER transporter 6TM N-terminal domain-containing protein n=1 Tax=Penicillium chermesinum TaxID=63820 RepID=A0A9W9TCA1_9EURO|nr:uncharacterized protein N7468_010451 [Penicillium chermesinum]KAJ5217443.1 hypothetical protein N7468_010451 [Penicillium chermesinum]
MPEETSAGSAGVAANSPDTRSRRRGFTLPGWLDHFNKHDLKIVFRCWVAVWVATILMFIGPALHSIGIATFFGSLLLYIVPPAGILFVYLLGALSLLFGMCLAWAWGLIMMKAALAARPGWQTQEKLLALEKAAGAQAQQTGHSPSWVTQELIHNGFMLDARVTVIFFVLSCLFVYFMARLRAANPKFTLAEMFGNIVLDLFLLFGPGLPSWTGSLGKLLVEPGAIGIALGFICCLLFFPQSTSYAVLAQMEKLIRMGEGAFQCTRDRLASEKTDLDRMEGVKAKAIGAYRALHPMMKFLPLDVSRGRWSADDVKGLLEPVRGVMMAQVALLDFHIARRRAEIKLEALKSPSDGSQDEGRLDGMNPEDEKEQDTSRKGIARCRPRENVDMMHALTAPELGAIRSRVLEALRDTTDEILQVFSEAVTVVADSIHVVNTRRWFGEYPEDRYKELLSRCEKTVDRLRRARQTFITDTPDRLIECHQDLFNASGQLKSPELLGPHALQSLVRGIVIEERIFSSAIAMESLLEKVLHLSQTRTKHRLWFPIGFRYAISWVTDGREGAPMANSSIGTGDDPDAVEELTKEAYRQLRISRGYGSARRQGRVSRIVRGIWGWLTNTGGMYALRMVIVTIATAIPAVLPSTAGFFYRERGIWGVITAQIGVLTYMADFAFSFLGRLIGTVIGGVIGMVAWYIGSGHGPGNPYGMAAITAVATLILIWGRLFLPPPFVSGAIMAGVTFSLVIGFSYDDGHIQTYGLPGRVTVLLGLVAAFVVQVFPRPPSASRHIRKTLANTIRTLSDHYALLLSHWDCASDRSAVDVVAVQISLSVVESLLALQGPIGLLKLELSLDAFDRRTLGQVQRLCQDINQALGHLLTLSGTLPISFQTRLVQTTGILDDLTIGNVMAVLGVIEQALKTGMRCRSGCRRRC